MLCCSKSVVNNKSDCIEGTVLRCNRWKCDYCLPFKRRALIELGKAGEATVFITLTSARAVEADQDEAARELVRAWRLTVKRAKRRFHLAAVPYLAVIEATKLGRPHLHIIARVSWLAQKWLSTQMAELANAPIVWIESIKGRGKVAAYVSKYIGKEPHHFAGCKRYWRSLDWIKNKQQWEIDHAKTGEAWTVCNYSLQRLADNLLRAGYAISWPRPDYLLAEPGAG